jgi:hypothetical protein
VTTKEMAIRVFAWEHGGTNFTSQLFSLYRKADPINATKLLVAFPEEIKALNEFFACKNAQEFYNRYEIGSGIPPEVKSHE